jgi:predicted O-methyltransferase YrrM
MNKLDFIKKNMQWYHNEEEIRKVAEFISKTKGKLYLEIGVRDGAALCYFSNYLSDDCILIGIDGNKDSFNHHIVHSLLKKNQIVKFIQGRSGSIETVLEVTKLSNYGYFDVVFVDGGHTYDEVRNDFQIYIHRVTKDGILIFHDIFCEECPDVGLFWTELKNNNKGLYEFHEIQGSKGFGIVWVRDGYETF